jgi:GTP-binding protein
MVGRLFARVPTMKILSAEFVTSAVSAEGWPKPERLEIAFAGRSNVGKSSMINALCERRKLVRVSNTPGRTRLLNFFDVELETEARARYALRLCDLPGYGFAKVSRSERREWREMIDQYVAKRESLCAVVCIVDANVGPTQEDADVVDWMRASGRNAIVAATKIDKLPKHRRIPRTHEIEKLLRMPEGQVIGVSPTERMNLEALWEKILAYCGGAKQG